MKTIFILTIALLFSSVSSSQIIIEKSKLEIDSLGGNVFLFVQQTNIANPSSIVYVTPETSLLIDPGFKQMQPFIIDSIHALGGSNIKYTMLTHFHIDHGQALEDYYDDAILLLTADQHEELKKDTIKNVITSPSPFTITLENEVLEVHNMPIPAGHTEADALFFFRNGNVLVVGDYLFQDMYPIIDVTGGGSIKGYLSNINYILESANDSTKIIPGHTSFKSATKRYLTKSEYQSYTQLLENSVNLINDMKESGLSLKEAIDKGLPESYKSFNEGIVYVSEKKWITNVYENY